MIAQYGSIGKISCDRYGSGAVLERVGGEDWRLQKFPDSNGGFAMASNTENSNSSGKPDRRDFLKAATAVVGGSVLGLSMPTISVADGGRAVPVRTLVGAIRWDAWVGGDWKVGSSVNRTLSPDRYQFRLPFYADITRPRPVLVEQDFDAEESGAAPAGWKVSAPPGTVVSVVEMPGREGKAAYLQGTSTAAMTRAFSAQKGALTVQWQWKEAAAGKWSAARLCGGSAVAVELATRGDAGAKELVYRTPDGAWNVVQAVADDAWYSIKIIADPAPPEGASPWVDIFVDGQRKVHNAPFRSPTATLDALTFGTSENASCEVYIDNVRAEITEVANSDATTQRVMDREIKYAKQAGIDYWAFVYYPQQPLARARELYFASKRNGDVNWCAILDGNFTSNYATNLPKLVARFSDPNYQRVLEGRPLVYFFGGATADWVVKMRAACSQAKLPDPYIVVMAWTAQSAADLKVKVGADAVSRYATGMKNGQPYSDLVDHETSLWDQYAVSAGDVVPTVSTGWDKRPRYDYPFPYESNYEVLKDEWTQQATPEEIAAHLRGAVRWNNSHPSNAPANTVLIYAWNEFDEGGWICPTLSELQEAGRPLRLDAIAKVPRSGIRK
ncbi:twin-arginine translocation signal domain-containing protein [Streptomyces sp. NPDC058001]|uniref:twin-arginine translocation signal domain-containing protein n=1 Tax=Streptomyces sp. NPDC058001 TaxID=3346300 RepID=UPI0036E0BFAB